MQNLLDRALGKYVILEEIGRGGMAAVYKARDVELDRIVAMKVLSPYLVGEPRLVQRFMGEARLAANLDHPNIVTIYDIGGEGGYYYFVMKFLDGRSLKEILAEQGPLPLQEVLDIVRQLSSALDYAHRQNLIHRDVKPGNVIISADGQAVLTDFGLAKVAENLKLTASGETIGTLEYMAPEQARGDAEKQSDIYSLGVIVYEMLAGRLPFQGNNQATLLYQHLHDPPPPLRQWNPEIHPEMEQAVLKAMAKDPAERFESVGEFYIALEQAARKSLFAAPARRAERGKAAPRVGLAGHRSTRRLTLPPWLSRGALPPFLRRWGWAILGGVALLAVLIGVGVVLRGALASRPTSTAVAVATTSLPPSTSVATPVRTPVETAVPTAVAGATRPVGPAYANNVFIPLLEQPVSPPAQIADAQFALRCDLDPEGALGHLYLWPVRSRQPTPWSGVPPDYVVVSQMSWAPQGEALVFVVSEAGTLNLFRVQADGEGFGRLTSSREDKEDPAWSPEGMRIVFADGPQGRRTILQIPAVGGPGDDLTPGGADNWAPSWSPDHESIVFVSDRDGNTEIYQYSFVGDELTRLTDDPSQDIYPVLSPDGSQLAFLSNRSGDFRLYVMDMASQEVEIAFEGAVWLERPSWSPRGDWIAFTRRLGAEPAQIVLLELSSGELYEGPLGCRQPAWRPEPETEQ